MRAASQWRCWALLVAVVGVRALAQNSSLNIEGADACPTAEQLRERLIGPTALSNPGRWDLKLTRPDADTLFAVLAHDGQIVGRRKLKVAGATCTDVAHTVALLVSSWLSAGAGTQALSAIEQTVIDEPTVSVSAPKVPAVADRPGPAPRDRARPKSPLPGDAQLAGAADTPLVEGVLPKGDLPRGNKERRIGEEPYFDDDVGDRPKRSSASATRWSWAVRAAVGAHWSVSWGMQGALGFDVGAGTGWGLQMSLKAYTPRAVTIAVGSLSWWGSEASVGVRGAYDLWGVASWEWSVIAGGRITALSARGLEQTGPAVAFAPIAGASLGLRVALSDRWWLLGEVGFTAQPWEERWLVAGGGTVPVSWFSGALSVGVQRTFL